MADERPQAPRPELLALLDAVKDHPDEDTPRLVLADWLDEQGDPLDAARAAFIRRHVAQCRDRGAEAFIASTAPAWVPLWQRWLGPFDRLDGHFERGLPVLSGDLSPLLKFDPTLLTSETFAFVQHVSAPLAEQLAALPEFRCVPGLSVGRASPQFFRSANLTGLRRLDLHGPASAAVRALAKNPALARLRTLNLRGNRLADGPVGALAAARHLARLEVLDLAENNVGESGAEALAASPTFTNLRKLDLRNNPRLTDRGKQLLRDKFGARVLLD